MEQVCLNQAQAWLCAVFLLFDVLWWLTGYERYNAMRADPALCFLEKVGMPDEKLLSAEQGVSDGAQDTAERWAGDGAKLSGAVWLAPGGRGGSGAVLWVSCVPGGGRKQTACLSAAGRGEGSGELDPQYKAEGRHKHQFSTPSF